jgi:hypothetical protein
MLIVLKPSVPDFVASKNLLQILILILGVLKGCIEGCAAWISRRSFFRDGLSGPSSK